jgi:transcriptional regulator with GAF, ATPase, and Fis domain
MGIALTVGLSKLVDEAAKSSQWMNSNEMVEKLVTELAKTFQVKLDEVAILHVTHGGSVLSFIYPFKLQKVGSIPMSSTASLAVRTVREKRPEMINNFPAQKHPTIFEAVDLSAETKGSPIQKIMSAPLISEGKAVGVIQVSRKGKTGPAAGPDFAIKDLTTLMTTAGILAKLFKAIK